ncbi:hypothetical protein Q2T49_34350, partial [Pseudomonas aeruginosa]|nr:hypothetical protein [Pseudomonas aeruginosa]
RADDQEVLALIQPLLHPETDVCVRAERAFNAYLEGGCQVPIAGYATLHRADDQEVLALIQPLLHPETDVCVRAERAFNAYL